jgi:hypothetical protein
MMAGREISPVLSRILRIIFELDDTKQHGDAENCV